MAAIIELEEPPADQAETPPPRRRASWPYQLVLALALTVAAVGLLVLAGDRDGPDESGGNRALVDTEATTKAIGDVSNTLTRIFTYTSADLGTAERTANEALSGQAAAEYRRLFGKVREQAAAQRLTLTTRVVRAGVTSLDGNTARLLVFLDQTSTRAGRPNGTPAAAQLSVTAELRDGQWRITELRSS